MTTGAWFTRIVLAGAVALWGYATWRVATAHPITLPHRVTWMNASGYPMELGRYDGSHCISRQPTIAVGDRLIVNCDSRLAWIEPRTATAKLAWPLPPNVRVDSIEALAPRADGAFGIAFDANERLLVGLAGRDGWLVPPTVVGNRINGHDQASALAMVWNGDAVEIVLRHPVPGFGNDPFGTHSAPDLVRMTTAGQLTRSRLAFPNECDDLICRRSLAAALPSAAGWQLVAIKSPLRPQSRVAELISPDGMVTRAPDALAWWTETSLMFDLLDVASLGIVGLFGRSTDLVERDGTRHAAPLPPLAGLESISSEQLWLSDGVLRRIPMWATTARSTALFGRLAIGDLVILDLDDEVRSIGRSVMHVVPVVRGMSPRSREMQLLPAPDGWFWVSSQGEYVTLDRELHRTDPLSLRDHLRTRGSTGWFIDEPQHVWRAGFLILGFPILILLALVIRGVERRATARNQPLLVAVVVYLVGSAWAFQVLHLL